MPSSGQKLLKMLWATVLLAGGLDIHFRSQKKGFWPQRIKIGVIGRCESENGVPERFRPHLVAKNGKKMRF